MGRVFLTVLHRDLLLAFRRQSDVWTTLSFFLVVACLFPLAVSPERDTLRGMAPGILWVAALLSSTLSLGRLFALDHADGTLEQLLLSPEPLSLIVLAKVAAHWLVSGLPLVLLSPLLALQYDLPPPAIAVLTGSLALGTPVLSLVGAIGAALTLGLQGGGRAGQPAGVAAARAGADLRGRFRGGPWQWPGPGCSFLSSGRLAGLHAGCRALGCGAQPEGVCGMRRTP